MSFHSQLITLVLLHFLLLATGHTPSILESRVALSEIPIVDISPLWTIGIGHGPHTADVSAMVQHIHYALSNIGFMYVTNHGIPQQVIDEAMSASKAFFDRSLHDKQTFAIETSGQALHGYTALFGENTDPTGKAQELKESFDFGRLAADNVTRPFFGPTPWPSSDFKHTMMAYHDAMLALARKIMVGIALSLDLPADFFDAMLHEPVGIARMMHYPPPPPTTAEKNVTGIGAHTDYGCLTILGQDDVGGLQVMNRDQQWIDAPPVAGTFIINIGDMIQMLTNDVYIANLHRFENTVGKDRYSTPFFFDVDFHTVFESLPQFNAILL
eukprot:CAMPEP_0202729910 /NCGR_PEP_ID=MMETSP1385-20130828/186376_1 /ASSEMBLY_ACC=CAM_ASM_000861 /TAXON_ID=933848 /ORGANISM="Elphidium margaritaceum" /LENGTH=326 /DNA_ID=CAMNT_0049396181 /DNA_START=40 /DNA_END=1020 /DNA_ORIENTATION=-